MAKLWMDLPAGLQVYSVRSEEGVFSSQDSCCKHVGDPSALASVSLCNSMRMWTCFSLLSSRNGVRM